MIDHKYGVFNYVISSQYGESENGGETKEMNILYLYVSNLANVNKLAMHMVVYDLKHIFLILSLILRYNNCLHAVNMWNNDETNMIKHPSPG